MARPLAPLLEDDDDHGDASGLETVLTDATMAESNGTGTMKLQDEYARTTPVHSRDITLENETLRGVMFGRSVRSSFVSLNLVAMEETSSENKEEDQYHVLVRIQFDTPCLAQIKELRSYFRRYCKYGDLLQLQQGIYQDVLDAATTEWQEPRFCVYVSSVQEAQDKITCHQQRCWKMTQCQTWQNKYYRHQNCRKQREHQKQKRQQHKNNDNKKNQSQNESSENCHHGGGFEKRQQGEFVANFLLNMIMNECIKQDTDNKIISDKGRDPSTWATSQDYFDVNVQQVALDYLNGGSGVLDVAGGSGHVSMALGLRGIQSTVVDPREAVGRLPGRDRKIYNRALKTSQQTQQAQLEHIENENLNNTQSSPSMPPISASDELKRSSTISSALYCQAIVRPFSSYRAWFGAPPKGVDTTFRLSDHATSVPICDAQSTILQNCRAIVALHPDEATDAIVDMAVHLRIPFVIVPCCVFCRLFPNRRMPSTGASTDYNDGENNNKNHNNNNNNAGNSNGLVSTYQDLLEYLQAKHPSIQRAQMPFVGANTVLYSTFDTCFGRKEQ